MMTAYEGLCKWDIFKAFINYTKAQIAWALTNAARNHNSYDYESILNWKHLFGAYLTFG